MLVSPPLWIELRYSSCDDSSLDVYSSVGGCLSLFIAVSCLPVASGMVGKNISLWCLAISLSQPGVSCVFRYLVQYGFSCSS